MREQAEPRDGFEPVPFWVTLIFGGLLAWGGYYVGANTADFRRDVFDRSDLKIAESMQSALRVTSRTEKATPAKTFPHSMARSGSPGIWPHPPGSPESSSMG
jgi:hypothetical protein